MIRRSRFASRALLAGILAVGIAGCGTSFLVESRTDHSSGRIVGQGSADTPELPDEQTPWRQLLAEITSSWLATRNLKCNFNGYFVSMKDGRSGSTSTNFYYEKPQKIAVVILSSTSGTASGTKAVWMGDKTMAIRTKFLGFWVKTALDIHDERALDQRGYAIDETGIDPTMNTLIDPRNSVTMQGSGSIDGIPILKVGLVSPRSLKAISREVFSIEAKRKIPIVREMYDTQDRLVYRVKMDGVVLNSDLPSSTFKID